MFSLESFKKQYDVDTTDVTIRERGFRFFVNRSLDPFIDSEDIFHDFPLWTKIWEASIVLADYLAGLDVKQEKSFLEIGCGIGLVGIVAASFGHRMIMTEYNRDALNFARANAQLNQTQDLDIRKLDWNRPQLEGTYDYIVGSEVIYKERDFESLTNLFRTYLVEGGEIILAEGIRKTSMAFMKKMGDRYQITAQRKVLRGNDTEIPLMLARMRGK